MSSRFHRPIAILAKSTGPYHWIPDSRLEQLESWLCAHRLETIIGYLIAFVAGFWMGSCVFGWGE